MASVGNKFWEQKGIKSFTESAHKRLSYVIVHPLYIFLIKNPFICMAV